jgi:hypothetical protein
MKFIPFPPFHDRSAAGLEKGFTQNLSVHWGVPMLRLAPDSEVIALRDLKDQRKSLWRRFEDNPNEIHLAARLRFIDDQIAQFKAQSDRTASKQR